MTPLSNDGNNNLPPLNMTNNATTDMSQPNQGMPLPPLDNNNISQVPPVNQPLPPLPDMNQPVQPTDTNVGQPADMQTIQPSMPTDDGLVPTPPPTLDELKAQAPTEQPMPSQPPMVNESPLTQPVQTDGSLFNQNPLHPMTSQPPVTASMPVVDTPTASAPVAIPGQQEESNNAGMPLPQQQMPPQPQPVNPNDLNQAIPPQNPSNLQTPPVMPGSVL